MNEALEVKTNSLQPRDQPQEDRRLGWSRSEELGWLKHSEFISTLFFHLGQVSGLLGGPSRPALSPLKSPVCWLVSRLIVWCEDGGGAGLLHLRRYPVLKALEPPRQAQILVRLRRELLILQPLVLNPERHFRHRGDGVALWAGASSELCPSPGQGLVGGHGAAQHPGAGGRSSCWIPSASSAGSTRRCQLRPNTQRDPDRSRQPTLIISPGDAAAQGAGPHGIHNNQKTPTRKNHSCHRSGEEIWSEKLIYFVLIPSSTNETRQEDLFRPKRSKDQPRTRFKPSLDQICVFYAY